MIWIKWTWAKLVLLLLEWTVHWIKWLENREQLTLINNWMIDVFSLFRWSPWLLRSCYMWLAKSKVISTIISIHITIIMCITIIIIHHHMVILIVPSIMMVMMGHLIRIIGVNFKSKVRGLRLLNSRFAWLDLIDLTLENISDWCACILMFISFIYHWKSIGY